ncbi:cation-transporting P-type ATPase, partial [Microbacterium sp.]|uniref:cation-transporting P-type ATPase n=1 Tax=Microbacterium sp. TaxID=51671 RepID=UPI00289DE35E
MVDTLTDAQLTVPRPYALDADEVRAALRVGADGLSADHAAARREIAGPNLLPEAKRTPGWLRFLSHFNDTLIYILLAAAAIKAVM